MNKRQQKKSVSKFINGGAHLTPRECKYLSKKFGFTVLMNMPTFTKTISNALKELPNVLIKMVDNVTPFIKLAMLNIEKLNTELVTKKGDGVHAWKDLPVYEDNK